MLDATTDRRKPSLDDTPSVAPYLLLRVSGVPIDALQILDAPTLSSAAGDALAAETKLGDVRSTLRDLLYDYIPKIEVATDRHKVLNLKRALGRPETTVPLQSAEYEEVLPPALHDRLKTAIRLAEEWEEDREAFSAAFDRTQATLRSRFKNHIARATTFQKGLLLSSQSLYRDQERYMEAEATRLTRKLESVEASLVAYFCRAAAKTSPFSTFTATAIGRWSEDASLPAHAGDGVPVSRVRLNRMALRRVLERLKQRPAIQNALTLSLNATLQKKDGQYYFYRQVPTDLNDAIHRSWITVHEAFDSIKETASMAAIYEMLATSPRRQADVIDRLCTVSPTDRADIRAYIDALVERHVLQREFPFSSLRLDFEHRVKEWFSDIQSDLAATCKADISRLLNAIDAYADASVDERVPLLQTIDDTLRALEDRVDLTPYEATDMYEDAVLESPQIAIPRHSVGPSVTRDLATLARTSGALQQRHQTRQRIASYFSSRWSQESVPFLDFFHTYSADSQAKEDEALLSDADTSRLNNVTNYQETLKQTIRDHCYREEEAVHIDPAVLEAKLDEAPDEIALPRSAAFFAQLGTDPTHRWKVNLPLEGYGKFFSRFAHLFGEGASDTLLASIRRQMRDSYQEDGIVADIGATFGSNVNLHRVHTSHVLHYPGSPVTTEASQRIDLRDLHISLDEHNIPQLRSASLGKRVYPMHFGFLVPSWLPRIARFLLDFSPAKASFIPWHELAFGEGTFFSEDPPDVVHQPQIRFGDVLIYRDRWHVPAENLPVRDPDDSDDDYYLKIQRWWRRLNLPVKSFVVIDNVTTNEVDEDEFRQAKKRDDRVSKVFKRKPQYVNLASPLFLRRFEKIVEVANYRLSFEAMYPRPDDAVVQSERGPHVSEFVLEISM